MADSTRKTEFDQRYKAGFWASRIETQDKVAAIVSVEALGEQLELVPQGLSNNGGRLAFEAREDFEIRWRGGRQYVSVKDRQVGRPELREAITNLESFHDEVGHEEAQSIRLEVAGLTSSARSFYEDVQRLRTIRTSGSDEESATIAREFSEEHEMVAEFAEKLVVTERRVGQSPGTAAALFAHAMRVAVRVHNYSDTELISAFEQLANQTLRDRRLTRGVLSFGELERILVAPLVPLQIAWFQVAYTRTQFGYIRDKDREGRLRQEQQLVMSYSKALMREWRRKTYWDRFKDSWYRGHVGCLACGHPLIANYNGRNGLACPDCGYQPFLTLFYACDCRQGAVVQRQPNLSSFQFVRDAIRILRRGEVVCSGCNKPPSDEQFIGRLFTLPIPYPIDGYPTKMLVEWREKLGWRSAYKFANEGQRPHDALVQSRIDDDADDDNVPDDTEKL